MLCLFHRFSSSAALRSSCYGALWLFTFILPVPLMRRVRCLSDNLSIPRWFTTCFGISFLVDYGDSLCYSLFRHLSLLLLAAPGISTLVLMPKLLQNEVMMKIRSAEDLNWPLDIILVPSPLDPLFLQLFG